MHGILLFYTSLLNFPIVIRSVSHHDYSISHRICLSLTQKCCQNLHQLNHCLPELVIQSWISAYCGLKFKVHIKPFRILHICDMFSTFHDELQYIFLREKLHLHGLFGC